MTIADRPALAVPAPTTDLDRARQDLASTGLCVVGDVLTGDTLTEVQDALYRAARSDRRRGRDAGIRRASPLPLPRASLVAHLCNVAHLNVVARSPRQLSARPSSMAKLAKLRSWKQRSLSNRNK